MKVVHLFLDDEDHAALLRKKGKTSWKEFVMQLAKEEVLK